MAATLQRPSGLARRRETKFEQHTRLYKDGDAWSVIHRTVAASGLVNATATTIGTLVIPNQTGAGGLKLTVTVALGDGDASEVSVWDVAVSRIAGAAAKVTVGSKTGAAATTGATGNAAVTLTAAAVVGANTAQQTVALQAAVARSAGTSDNHDLVADVQVSNVKAGGITFQ
jgi:hypothetical protein